MFKFAVLLLQLASQVLRYLERQRLIAEGERRQLARELEGVARASRLSLAVQENVRRMHDDEVDAALRGDYRD